MDKTEVRLDFHIFAILEFDLLLGYPFEKLFQEKSSHGSLNEKLTEATFATPTSYLKFPMAKHHPNHDSFEEVKFVSLLWGYGPRYPRDKTWATPSEVA